MPQLRDDPIGDELRGYIENKYSPIPRDEQEKVIDNVLTLIELVGDKRRPLTSILEQVAKTIFRLFDFSEVAIGLKNRKDNTFRYELLFGFRREIDEKFRKLVYTLDDMTSYDLYPSIKTGRLSDLKPAEGVTDEEREFFNRPTLFDEKRKTPEEFHGGDYLDFYMYGFNKELIGWIEVSAPRSGKQPSRNTVRWIELIASMCALIVLQKWAEEDAARR